MEIQFKGESCFTLKNEKGTQIIIDPVPELKDIAAKIVTFSQGEGNNKLDGISGNPKVFNWPGEYEIDGIAITGIPTHDNKKNIENITFKFVVDHIRICHMGNFNIKASDEILDKIGNVEILIIPVGGDHSLNAEQAKEIIEEIDPRIIIPMHYQMNGEEPKKGTLQDFLKKMGKTEIEAQDTYVIKKHHLPDDKSEIIVLNTTS